MLSRLSPRPPAIVAHRGASVDATENTLAAFLLARSQGADAVELDVRRCRDGALLVHHDPTLGEHGPLVSLSRADVRAVAPAVPELGEALAATGGMWVNVEIKNHPDQPDFDSARSVAAAVAEMVATGGHRDRVLVSSFDPASIARVRELDPEIATGLLVGYGADPQHARELAAAGGHQALIAPYQTAGDDSGLAAGVHSAGLWLIGWTVNHPDDVRRLAAQGWDAIITDVPAIARRSLAR